MFMMILLVLQVFFSFFYIYIFVCMLLNVRINDFLFDMFWWFLNRCADMLTRAFTDLGSWSSAQKPKSGAHLTHRSLSETHGNMYRKVRVVSRPTTIADVSWRAINGRLNICYI